MVLRLSPSHLKTVSEHARNSYPRECCGIFLGTYDGVASVWSVTEVCPAKNLVPDSTRDRYQMDPLDRYKAEARARALGLQVVGFYHSHPDHGVYFSDSDLRNSEEFLLGEPWLPPTYAYLVISVRAGQIEGQGAFIVRDGRSQPLACQTE